MRCFVWKEITGKCRVMKNASLRIGLRIEARFTSRFYISPDYTTDRKYVDQVLQVWINRWRSAVVTRQCMNPATQSSERSLFGITRHAFQRGSMHRRRRVAYSICRIKRTILWAFRSDSSRWKLPRGWSRLPSIIAWAPFRLLHSACVLMCKHSVHVTPSSFVVNE